MISSPVIPLTARDVTVFYDFSDVVCTWYCCNFKCTCHDSWVACTSTNVGYKAFTVFVQLSCIRRSQSCAMTITSSLMEAGFGIYFTKKICQYTFCRRRISATFLHVWVVFHTFKIVINMSVTSFRPTSIHFLRTVVSLIWLIISGWARTTMSVVKCLQLLH